MILLWHQYRRARQIPGRQSRKHRERLGI